MCLDNKRSLSRWIAGAARTACSPTPGRRRNRRGQPRACPPRTPQPQAQRAELVARAPPQVETANSVCDAQRPVDRQQIPARRSGWRTMEGPHHVQRCADRSPPALDALGEGSDAVIRPKEILDPAPDVDPCSATTSASRARNARPIAQAPGACAGVGVGVGLDIPSTVTAKVRQVPGGLPRGCLSRPRCRGGRG
jgi:hypothetical protein